MCGSFLIELCNIYKVTKGHAVFNGEVLMFQNNKAIRRKDNFILNYIIILEWSFIV